MTHCLTSTEIFFVLPNPEKPEKMPQRHKDTKDKFIKLSSPALLNIEKPGSIFVKKYNRISKVSEI